MKGTHTVSVSDQVVEAVPGCDVSGRGVDTNETLLVLRSGSRIKSSGEESEMTLSFASIQLRTVVPPRTLSDIHRAAATTVLPTRSTAALLHVHVKDAQCSWSHEKHMPQTCIWRFWRSCLVRGINSLTIRSLGILTGADAV